MTKALKNRLQKLINAIPNENISEFWKEFSERMEKKEHRITQRFKVGDEVEWDHQTGTIIETGISNCRVRESNKAGTTWTISSCMLAKIPVIK